MNTTFLLMAQYEGQTIIPIQTVCKDFFGHLTLQKFLRKHNAGEIDLPVVRIEDSQKSAKGVHISDLAQYVDQRRNEATKENNAMFGR
ncbi:pyocin activator PrtN family protein [Pseudovibrio denitrificans]|uniref:pyocin activator PrtN family protein n=1 Tax=Pseudovibrio denitrificans TaxID=258256 RepID=UPI0039BF67AC